ncbi:MAG TPA: queuosine precursor transporter [Candidatus Amulumruptor caecigallinarius]|uniref:Probable queuosine precursor transporter n=1 Tax=Candidatus Amulumruptor caecigallinarius TaxID=2109911 RepID=A0A921JI45_9BACT|nr:queuosine precursor transporter [Candidatus Amulumruptor caecigallinarius]
MLQDTLHPTHTSTSETLSRERFSLTFLLLTVTFCVCLIISNLMEIKTVDLGFMTITAGVAVFPISYIINDCIVEIYGFRKARLVILLGFTMNLLTVMLLHLGLWLPGSDTWTQQEAMEAIFGAAPRILCASFTAFLAGSLTNAWVMAKMKQSASADGRNATSAARFSARAILSTIWGEGIDSIIFFPLAFAGVLPWGVIISLILTQTVLKTVYEIIALPLTVILVKKLRHMEWNPILSA